MSYKKTLLLLTLFFAVTLPMSAYGTVLTEAQKPNAKLFGAMRYGMFSTVVYNISSGPAGTRPYKTLDDFANGFDVNAYADSLKKTGVEYVIFTEWHKAMYNLGPNAALEKWLPGHTCKRDLIGVVADALDARGIKLIIYAHPNDGHDLKPEEKERVGFVKPENGVKRLMPKFNDFINEVYAETAARAARHPNVLGFWWDSWSGNGRAIDMPRLRKTLLEAMPRAIVLSNNGPAPDWVDYLSLERYYTHGPKGDIDNLIALDDNQTTIFAGDWACRMRSNETSLYSPETLFRFTAFNACAGAPGGMAWAVSPAFDGKTWGTDNLAVMTRLGALIAPVRESICGVRKSRNWTIPTGSRYSTSCGYGATRSLDGKREYLHVLRHPDIRSIDVELPVETFTAAKLFSNGHPVELELTAKALRLTLGVNDRWEELDTVIVLDLDSSPSQRP